MRASVVVSVLCAVLAAAVAVGQETYLLRYKFEPVKIWEYKMAMDMDGTIGGIMGADDQEMSMSQSMIMKHKLAGAKDGVGTYVTSFRDFEFEATVAGIDAGAMSGLDTEALEKMLITSKMNERGETLDTKFEGLPEEMSQMNFAGAATFNIMGMMPVFPEKAIKVGESWVSMIDNPMVAFVGEMASGKDLPQIKVTSKLLGIEKLNDVPAFKLAIKVDFPFDMDLSEMLEAQMGAEMTMTMKGSAAVDGTLWLDMETCHPIKMVYDSTNDMTMTFSNPMGGDQSMRMTMGGTGRLDLLPPKE
jgi:hypothetical protein